MKTDPQVYQRACVELLAEPTARESSNDDAWIVEIDGRHLRNNILEWMSYLPDDCVKKMIEMGWDVST
jgi:hypothetical protein